MNMARGGGGGGAAGGSLYRAVVGHGGWGRVTYICFYLALFLKKDESWGGINPAPKTSKIL